MAYTSNTSREKSLRIRGTSCYQALVRRRVEPSSQQLHAAHHTPCDNPGRVTYYNRTFFPTACKDSSFKRSIMRLSRHESLAGSDTTYRNPICPNWIRILVVLSIRFVSYTGLIRCFKRKGGVIFISGGICIKISSASASTEPQTLAFVRHCTSLPVPKVYYAFEKDNRNYMIMERLHGNNLAQGWTRRSALSKQTSRTRDHIPIANFEGLFDVL